MHLTMLIAHPYLQVQQSGSENLYNYNDDDDNYQDSIALPLFTNTQTAAATPLRRV